MARFAEAEGGSARATRVVDVDGDRRADVVAVNDSGLFVQLSNGTERLNCTRTGRRVAILFASSYRKAPSRAFAQARSYYGWRDGTRMTGSVEGPGSLECYESSGFVELDRKVPGLWKKSGGDGGPYRLEHRKKLLQADRRS